MVISLARYTDGVPPYLQAHVDQLFPDGLSIHGKRYLIDPDSRGNLPSAAIELLFEHVRRASFSECPSRFQSFFACTSIEDAHEFRKSYGNESVSIFEIYTENEFFKGNMRLLDNNQTNLVCSYLAHEYWTGNPGPSELVGLTEVLLNLPVTVGPRVA